MATSLVKYQRKPIKDFPGYEIDTEGNVYTCWKRIPIGHDKLGRIIGSKNILSSVPKKLKPSNISGYLRVVLYKKKIRHRKTVHRLLAETFIKNKYDYPIVCHNNGNSLDNKLSNLRWDTFKSNTNDRKKHGTFNIIKGEKASNSKLRNIDIIKIRDMYKTDKYMQKELAKIFGVTPPTIYKIIHRLRWSHII